MSSLWYGFYGEGKRDYGFLQPLMQRILESFIPHVDIFLLPVPLPKKGLSQIQKVQYVAEATSGYNFVIFHLDADATTTEKAYQERFLPGYSQLDTANSHLNRDIIPLIPVRMTDAWLLVDELALDKVLRTKMDLRMLGVPEHPHQVEAIFEPKAIFDTLLRQAGVASRSMTEIYATLAQTLDLARLDKVPAYQEFKARLVQTLKDQHYL